jgi:septum formation protein
MTATTPDSCDDRPWRLVLASQSPRRIEMMRALGLKVDCIPSSIDETTDLRDPAQVVEELAAAKAQAVYRQLQKDEPAGHKQNKTLILGADTIVVLGQEILGKPASREDAYQMLMRMSGRCHRVYTGVALVDGRTDQTVTNHEVSHVYFRSLDPAEVRWYAKTEEPMDKAGAYALQGTAGAFVQKIDGCYTNVIGLPMPLTVRMLRHAGIPVLGMS